MKLDNFVVGEKQVNFPMRRLVFSHLAEESGNYRIELLAVDRVAPGNFELQVIRQGQGKQVVAKRLQAIIVTFDEKWQYADQRC